MPATRLPRVGAPVVKAYSPRQGTASAALHAWLVSHQEVVQELLDQVTTRWRPLASFVEMNFEHPEYGPSGALVLTSTLLDTRPIRRRADRLRVIPHREVAEYLPVWERGITVEVAVKDMPEDLGRRYSTTPIHWSLNVPLHVNGSWVGLVGAATDERGFERRAVASYQALAKVLMSEFEADVARSSFDDLTGSRNRLLHLLR